MIKLYTVPSLLLIAQLAAQSVQAQGHTCAQATAVSGGIVYTIDTLWGDDEGYQYGCYPPATNDALWYMYRATYTGEVEVTSCSPITTMNTRVSIFTGTCDELECIAWNDDGNCPWVPTWLSSRVSFNVVKDEIYFIQWDNEWLPTSTINFQWIINSCEARVEGTVYRDLNSNSVRDAGEPLYNAILDRDGQGQYIYATGDPYLLCSPAGPHTITLSNPPLHYAVVPPEQGYSTVVGGYVTDMDFALQPIPGMYDGRISLWGSLAWIGNNSYQRIDYENIGTEPINATVVLNMDPQLEFVDALTTPSSISGQTVTWDVGTLEVGASGHIIFNMYTPITVPGGFEVSNTVLLQVTEPDVDLMNNADACKLPARVSVDPNDKQVDPVALSPEEVEEGKVLKYTVRFQNTGTAPAVNVVVRDTLDEALDMTSLEMIGATHNYQVSLSERAIAFTFPNIMLPDSSADMAGSMGALHYRIAVNTDLELGDEVHNEAHIFFDYADAVITNTVVTTVLMPTGISPAGAEGSGLLVFPSPAKDQLTVRSLNGITGAVRLVVLDALGRRAATQRAALHAGEDLRFDVSALPPGSYLLNVVGDTWSARQRFVIQH